MSFSSSFWYHFFCIALIPTYRLVRCLGSSDFSTSALIRRSRKGRRTLCSCFTTASWSSFCSSNHESKSAADPKTSGNRKLSSAHCNKITQTSSWRLFCKGVPVKSRRLRQGKRRTICERAEFSFLIRWASSITIYCHESFFKWLFSSKHISKDVTQTSKLPGNRVDLISSARSSFVPWNMNTFKSGTHFSNSFTQLCSVDLGTITMWGPLIFLKCFRNPKNEIVCSVFPSPLN